MNFIIELATPQRIVGRLRDGTLETEVSAWGAERAAQALVTALEAARDEGFGQCFWPEMTGQYWWMCRREGRRLEVVVLWSSGAGTGWQHVYRATDEIDYFIDCVLEQFATHGLFPPAAEGPRNTSQT
jgi:hypothetical protein